MNIWNYFARAKQIEQTLKFYTPDPLRWLAKINRLRKEGVA